MIVNGDDMSCHSVNHDDGEIDIHYLHPLPTNVRHTYHHPITLRYTHTFLFVISSFYITRMHTHGGSVWGMYEDRSSYGERYVFWRERGREGVKYRYIQRNSGDRMSGNHNQVRCEHTFTFTSCFTCVIHTQTIKVESMYTMFHGGGE